MSNLRWSYMDHWRADTPRGPMTQYASRPLMDDFVKQISAVGFEGLDMFDFQIYGLTQMFGSIEKYQEYLQDHGIAKIVNLFFCAIRTQEDILRFYELTDPRYVSFFCDTAQHCIAGVDPVELYLELHDRVSGFHFKDTREVDTTGAYENRPDAELMAPQTARWFYEMGTEGGLVDFPRLMGELKKHAFTGWITVEHDKANIGGDYAESTALSMWYAKRVLAEIYS
jgi:sugar phosphate isomerase/epimerase